MRTISRVLLSLVGWMAITMQSHATCTTGFPCLESDGSFNSGFGSLVLPMVSGRFNTAAGYRALASDAEGSFNTALGALSLKANTTGSENTALGARALESNSGGSGNTATGYRSLRRNLDGDNNTAHGQYALEANASGFANTALGSYAMVRNTSGYANTALGASTLANNRTGYFNLAGGSFALLSNTSGSDNTALGQTTLGKNTRGSLNTAIGSGAMQSNTRGEANTAVGATALAANSTGHNNAAFGVGALNALYTGKYNTAVGYESLFDIRSGHDNIAVGHRAGVALKTGDNNIAIGHPGVAGDNGVIRIGSQSVHTRTFIAGIRGANFQGATVIVSNTGQLGIQSSSRRYKEDIRPMADASAPLLKLKPVRFRYKQVDEHGNQPLQFGLIAEEVAEVMPELVIYNQQGRAETVAYQTLASMLLNEFQKEHEGRLTEQSRADADLLKLTARAEAAESAAREANQSALQASQALVSMRVELARLEGLTRELHAAQSSAGKLVQAAR